MSHYTEGVMPNVRNKRDLLSALKECFPEATIEVHETPQRLVGYQGDTRSNRAEIIVRRQFVGRMSNDIGFRKEGTTWTAVISDYDRSKYNAQWLGRLGQLVGVHGALRVAKSQGQAASRITYPDGRIVVRARVAA